MRLINAIAMAIVAAAVVATAFSARHAMSVQAPNGPAPEAAAEANEGVRALNALANDGKTVLVVTRAKRGRLQPAAAASAMDVDAFSLALGRTFSRKEGQLAGHSRPARLPKEGPLASGFVATVDGFGGLCGFAIGGLDYSGAGGEQGLDASAALIFCAESPELLRKMAKPAIVAARIARLPAK